MQSKAKTVEEYFQTVQEKHHDAILELRRVILENLPEGFEERLSYGMVGYVVPHSLYPAGYHCDPKLPLPFVNLGSQKNYIALYHNGVYAVPALLEWFVTEYAKVSKHKLDMGKSCIRFKYMDDIPFDLIGQLISKMTVDEWITFYEKNTK